MFQNRRQATLGNINLGSLSAPPSYQDLSFLLEQAARYRGRFVEVSWQVPKTGATFQLTAKFAPAQGQPSWMLYTGVGGSSELIWGHNSNDLTLMHNLVMLECEKKEHSNNDISDGAMDSVMRSNRAVGAVANTADQAAAGLSGCGSGSGPGSGFGSGTGAGAGAGAGTGTGTGTGAGTGTGTGTGAGTGTGTKVGGVLPAPAKSATGEPGANPAATWLQNLSQSTGNLSAAVLTSEPALNGLGDATGNGAPPEPLESPVIAGLDLNDVLLDGNLSNITMPKLLSFLAHNQLTGRLALQSAIGAAEIFFKSGTMVHAATLDSRGESGLLDAATWTDGEFHFSPEDQTTQQSLTLPTKDMIIACQRMLAISKFLQQERVRTASYLVRNAEVNRAQFEQMLPKEDSAFDVHQLWRVYELVDGNRCLSDLLRLSPMTRAEWIQTVYALLNAGLLSISDRPVQTNPGMFIEGAPVDADTMEAFYKNLCDRDDEIMHYAPFLYFLQQEHHRFERTGARYALALFSLAATNLLDGNLTPFNTLQMKEAGKRLAGAKRKLDVVGHFKGGDYALLLPETDSGGACVFAHRIIDSIKKPALYKDDQVLVASFGIASCPDLVRDLAALIAAAKAAKSRSTMIGVPISVYGDN